MRFLMVLSVAMLMGCSSPKVVNYVIEGDAPAGMEGKMFYVHDYDIKENIDSGIVENGKLCISGTYDKNALVRIESGNVFSNCILDDHAVIDFANYWPAGGSELNVAFRDFLQKSGEFDTEMNDYISDLRTRGVEGDELTNAIKEHWQKLRPKAKMLYIETATANDNGLGYAALQYLVGINIDLQPQEWDSLYAVLPEGLKGSRLINDANERFEGIKKSAEGMPFVDLEGKNMDGSVAKLSDYAGKGKYVLVDFWASWCGPCKSEAKNTLRPLYEKYKGDDRLEIVGVAVWEEMDKTLKSLEDDPYPWPQIIDAGMEPMKKYGFDFIPMIILIGPDGTILEKNLRGEAIFDAIDSRLK